MLSLHSTLEVQCKIFINIKKVLLIHFHINNDRSIYKDLSEQFFTNIESSSTRTMSMAFCPFCMNSEKTIRLLWRAVIGQFTGVRSSVLQLLHEYRFLHFSVISVHSVWTVREQLDYFEGQWLVSLEICSYLLQLQDSCMRIKWRHVKPNVF